MYLSEVWWPKPRLSSGDSDICWADSPRLLSNHQWSVVADLFPQAPGGKRRVPPRDALEGILWVVLNGGRWNQLPDRFPSQSTCRRRYKKWSENGLFQEAFERLLSTLDLVERSRWEMVGELSVGVSVPQPRRGVTSRVTESIDRSHAAEFHFRPSSATALVEV